MDKNAKFKMHCLAKYDVTEKNVPPLFVAFTSIANKVDV